MSTTANPLSLLFLGACVAVHADQTEPFFRTVVAPISPRYAGQWNVAMTELFDGEVLAVWEAGDTETKTANVILSSRSGDGGRTWSPSSEFLSEPDRRLTPGGFRRYQDRLWFFYTDLPVGGTGEHRILRRSVDEPDGKLGEPQEIRRHQWMCAMQPLILSDGPLALPVYHTVRQADGEATSVSRLLLTADGTTWHEGGAIRSDTPHGAMEPAVVELPSGGLLCAIRTSGTAALMICRSDDAGETWSELAPSGLESPESIARLLRLNDGSVLVVWNGLASRSQGPRNVLTAARSTDGGRTWPQRRDLLRAPEGLYSNHGVAQLTDGRVLVACQSYHRDAARAPRRGGVDEVLAVGFTPDWLAAQEER